MKAIVYTKYGSADVLQLQDVPQPAPRDDELLVQVRAASVFAGDWRLMRGQPFLVRLDAGMFKPKIHILGTDMAGEVAAIGSKVTGFQVGDAVFGDLSRSGYGAFAEYVAVPESALALKPARMRFEEAATVPVTAVAALQGLRDAGGIQAGQKVLINGASGGVGSFAVQIAKAFGAEVTGTAGTSKMDLVRALGADHVIDYKKEDFTQNGRRYDLILNTAAYLPLSAYKRALSPTGTHVLVGGSAGRLLQAMFLGSLPSKNGGPKTAVLMAKPDRDDLLFITELLEKKQIVPVIDRCFPLAEVPEAIRYLEEGRARGKVAITIAG